MKAVFLFCIALFLHNCLFAQTNITGTIFNKQRPFREVASITISEKGSVEILAFTLSDEIGNYTLILNSTTDSLDIGVSHIGYASITERIPNKQQQINFNLQINEIKLPTVIVEQKTLSEKLATL